MEYKIRGYCRDEELYTLIELFGIPAVLTDSRVPMDMVPENMYRYMIRHNGEGEPSTLEEHVTINFDGTIITKQPIGISADDNNGVEELHYRNIFREIDYLDGYEITLRAFCESSLGEGENVGSNMEGVYL